MKHAVALSGGGFKGALQLGSLQVLKENNIKIEAVSGISVGALNASFIAQNKLDKLEEFWTEVVTTDGGFITSGNLADLKLGKLKPNFKKIKGVGMQGVSKWDITKALTSSFFKGQDLETVGNKIFNNIDYSLGILDNTPLAILLQENIVRQDFIMPYYFGLTELGSGEGFELSNKDFASDKDLANAILASATMPAIWDSVRYIQSKKGVIREAVDGGLRTVSPLGQLFDTIEKSKESEEWTIWVINCNARKLSALEDTRRQSVRISRTLDILLNQVFRDDIEKTILINEAAEQFNKRRVNINIIEPQVGIMGATLDATKEIIEKRIELGRVLTSNFF